MKNLSWLWITCDIQHKQNNLFLIQYQRNIKCFMPRLSGFYPPSWIFPVFACVCIHPGSWICVLCNRLPVCLFACLTFQTCGPSWQTRSRFWTLRWRWNSSSSQTCLSFSGDGATSRWSTPGPSRNWPRGSLTRLKSKAVCPLQRLLCVVVSSSSISVAALQEGAVGSVCVSGLVRSADSDPSGEPWTRCAGRHLLQHAHPKPRALHRGHASFAQKGQRAFDRNMSTRWEIIQTPRRCSSDEFKHHVLFFLRFRFVHRLSVR